MKLFMFMEYVENMKVGRKFIIDYNPTTYVDRIDIESATYVNNFVVHVNFNDGVSREVDFKPF
jgi:hypothetical protein